MDHRSRTRASYGGTGSSRFSRKRRSQGLLAEQKYRPLVSRRRIEEIRKQIDDDPSRSDSADCSPPQPTAGDDTEQIPPKILELAAIAPDSALYKALTKQPLFDWPLWVYPSVLNDLNQLLAACVTLKYVPESSYIDHVALDIRTERSERLVIRTLSLCDLETRLFETAEQLDRREQTFVSAHPSGEFSEF
jgi:hypothetical protein